MARRFLPSIGRKASPTVEVETKAAETERAAGLSTWQQARPLVVGRTARTVDVTRAVSETFERVSWVFRAVNAIASNQAALPIVMRRGDARTGRPIPGHVLSDLLNGRPNTFETRAEFRYRLTGQLLLSSRGVFVEHLYSRGGDLIGFQLDPPQYTKPIPHPTEFVAGYEVRIGSKVWTVPRDRMTWIKFPHPLDPYRSFTPGEAAGLAIDLDYLAAAYNSKFLRNDARPGGLIVVKGGIAVPADAEEIKSYFKGGGQPGAWRVIEGSMTDGGGGLDVADLSANPRDAQYVEGRAQTKVEIISAFGVPAAVIGDVTDQTFANSAEARKMFWVETMPSHCGLIAAALDTIDDDPSTFVDFDMSETDVWQTIAAERENRLLEEFKAGLITIDEYREATGRDPFGVTATENTVWRPMAVEQVRTDEEPPEPQALPAGPPLRAVPEGGEQPPAVESAGRGPFG